MIIAMVESAIRAKAPIVGIPIEGQRPFALRRDVLTGSLKGMRIIEAAIQMPLESTGRCLLQVFAVTPGGVKGTRTYYPLTAYDAGRLAKEWAAAQRKARSKPAAPKGARARHIAKLRKQLCAPKRPTFALLEDGQQAEPVPVITAGQHWRRWKQQAKQRRDVQRIARRVLAGTLTLAKAYGEVEALGLEVRRYSSLNTREKREYPDLTTAFLPKLWQFCGLVSKPWGFEPMDHHEADYGPRHYERWLSEVRKRNQLLSEIAAIEALGDAS